ncbi:MAG: hypothetical protein IPJ13_16880 [Saprospiraceae bacterium]|nr:hypothetical protein [Saprospiraceae bacterium]
MYNSIDIPEKLSIILKGHETYFVEYSQKRKPIISLVESIGQNINAIFLIIFSICAVLFFSVLIIGNSSFRVGWIFIIPILSILGLIGYNIFRIITHIMNIDEAGGYIAAIEEGIICLYDENFEFYKWGQFNGKIDVTGNDEEGNIILELHEKEKSLLKSMQKNKYIYISQITNAKEKADFYLGKIMENQNI